MGCGQSTAAVKPFHDQVGGSGLESGPEVHSSSDGKARTTTNGSSHKDLSALESKEQSPTRNTAKGPAAVADGSGSGASSRSKLDVRQLSQGPAGL